jgi:PTH1 family peptidyl-tRNA hydrolase
MEIQIAVFLGNPGPEYRTTRHNAGWLLADALPGVESVRWQTKFKGTIGQYGGPDGTLRISLLRPETFMNLSGESVQPAATFYKVKPDGLIVVHDEIELPFGVVSVRKGGGLGGHNGLRSISDRLGTRDFWRFRIGIGRPAHGSVSAHVLGRFSPEEEPLLDRFFSSAAELFLQTVKNLEVSRSVLISVE